MMALIKLNVRLALREEAKEREKGLKPTNSKLFWDEAFRCWREKVLREQRQ